MASDDDKPTTPQTSLVYMLLAVIAGGSSSIGLRFVDPPREDPFTGRDGIRLEETFLFRLEEETKDREAQYTEIIRRLEEHRAECKELSERLREAAAEHVEMKYNRWNFSDKE